MIKVSVTVKILILLITSLLFSPSIFAFYCYTNGGVEVGGGSQSINDVMLDNNIFSEPGRLNEFADIGELMTCVNQNPEKFIDYLYMTGAEVGPVFTNNPEIKAGVIVRGSNHTAPFSGKKIQVFRLTTESEPLQIKLYLQVKSKPSPALLVKNGDLLVRLNLYKYAKRINGNNEELDPAYFIWNLYAGNDVVVGAGTCDINDNQIIIVDFETVNASGISTVGSASRFQRNAEITYSCEDNNLTTPIKMVISGEPSIFSSNALLVRSGDIHSKGSIMPGLGVEVYHEGQRISPMNGNFDSKIENGHGRDTLMFTLVKKTNLLPNELIEGQFSSAATIIMTTP